MDPALYRWAISALAASVAMIAVFFFALRRSVRRNEMRWWSYAWAAEAAALAVVLVFWIAEPPPRLHRIIFFLYIVAKTLYVTLLLRGAVELHAARSRLTGVLHAPVLAPAVLVFAVGAAAFSSTLDRLG